LYANTIQHDGGNESATVPAHLAFKRAERPSAQSPTEVPPLKLVRRRARRLRSLWNSSKGALLLTFAAELDDEIVDEIVMDKLAFLGDRHLFICDNAGILSGTISDV
jgi:hypothetical protein